MTDAVCIDQLAALIEWCEGRGLVVEFVRTRNGGVYDHDAKCIRVSCHLPPEKQLHTLMHECGHHLVETKDRDSTDRFGNGYRASDPNVFNKFVHEIDMLDEEFEAWARGLRLAERLNIIVNMENYNHTKAECIRTHLKSALKVDGYGNDSAAKTV